MDIEKVKNPPVENRPVPFFSWNGNIKPDIMAQKYKALFEKGMGGILAHSRDGLSVPYLGEEWMSCIDSALQEAKKLGGELWIYDEDRFPSGAAGGMVCKEDPSLGAQFLLVNTLQTSQFDYSGMEELKLKRKFTLKQDGDFYFECSDDDPKSFKIEVYTAFTTTEQRWNDTRFPNLLDDRAVDSFIKHGYAPYDKYKKDFGKTIPVVFTDEPHIPKKGVVWGDSGVYPWSDNFSGEFKKRRGYSIEDKYPALFFNMESSFKVRHDFWRTITELFSENFTKKIAGWCEERKLAFTGHYLLEENMFSQIESTGAAMPSLRHMQMPGVDVLFRNQFEIVTVKQATSVANQFGRKYVMSETFGTIGWEITFAEMKMVAEWEMCLGINKVVPHLVHYTLMKDSKRDWPQSFTEHNSWWEKLDEIMLYISRLSYILSQGTPIRNTLLIHPIGTAWGLFDNNRRKLLDDITQTFRRIMEVLVSEHIDFDLGDELIIEEFGSVEKKKFVINKAKYETVIVPPVRTLNRRTYELIKEFAENGGRVIWLDASPERIDGELSDEIRKLIYENENIIVSAATREVSEMNRDLIEALLDFVPRSISIKDKNNTEIEKIIYQKRKLSKNKMLYYMYNRDQSSSFEANIGIPLAGSITRINPKSGKEEKMYCHWIDDKYMEVHHSFAPLGSLIIIVDSSEKAKKKKEKIYEREVAVRSDKPVSFKRDRLNSFVLMHMRYKEGESDWSSRCVWGTMIQHLFNKYGLWSYRNAEAQPWMVADQGLSCDKLTDIEIEYEFNIKDMPKTEIYLAMEEPERFQVWINGTEIEKDIDGSFLEDGIKRLKISKYLQKGGNLVKTRSQVTYYDIPEDIFILGDFAYNENENTIIKEPKKLEIGGLEEQGYPQYTGSIEYSFNMNLKKEDKERYDIEVAAFKGTLMTLSVNGKEQPSCMWHPYRLEATKALKSGKNEIGIKIYCSLKNLLGPRHAPFRYTLITPAFFFYDDKTKKNNKVRNGLFGDVSILKVANKNYRIE